MSKEKKIKLVKLTSQQIIEISVNNQLEDLKLVLEAIHNKHFKNNKSSLQD